MEDIFVLTNSKSEGRKEGKNAQRQKEEAEKRKSQSNNPHKQMMTNLRCSLFSPSLPPSSPKLTRAHHLLNQMIRILHPSIPQHNHIIRLQKSGQFSDKILPRLTKSQ